uniref:CRAL-TRIO domain-containing protein n=1 Tax=Zea mays TaxID=4577 RepID=A0A804PM78_MAIZE
MAVTVEKGSMGEPALLLERSRAITLHGRDRKGRAVVRIVGNYFPARALGGRAEEALRSYLRERILPEIGDREFVVVYMHSRVDRGHNFPGVGAIRGAYETLPAAAKERLRAVYFVHPALQSRIFFATFGRFLFSSGYGSESLIRSAAVCIRHARGAEFLRGAGSTLAGCMRSCDT